MKWKEWLEGAEGLEKPRESDVARKFREGLEAKLGHALPEGMIVEGPPSVIELAIGPTTSEDEVTQQVVKALKEMTEIVTRDMEQKYKYSQIKLKAMVAEEFYRQLTSSPTFAAKNFGDSKLVQ